MRSFSPDVHRTATPLGWAALVALAAFVLATAPLRGATIVEPDQPPAFDDDSWLYAVPAQPSLEALDSSLRQGQYREVLQRGKALLQTGGNGRLYGLLAVALAGLGQFEEAAKAAQKAAEADPPEAHLARLAQAMTHQGRQQHDQAIAASQEAIRLDPGHPLGHLTLGLAHFAKGAYEEAEKPLKKAVALENALARGHTALGANFLLQKKVSRAFLSYRKAVEADPRDARPHMGLGTIYMGMNRPQQAIGEYETVLRLDPSSLQARSQLALLYLKVARYDDAIAAATAVLSKEPSSREALFVLGRAHSFAGRFTEAADYLERLIALRPDEAAAHYLRGLCKMAAGEMERAQEHFWQTERLTGRVTDTAVASGVVHHVIGNPREAIAQFERALNAGADPASGLVHLLTANAYAAQRQWDQARRHLDDARPFFGGVDAGEIDLEQYSGAALDQTNLAAFYLTKGWLDKALEACDAALDHAPPYPLARYIKGKVLLQRQDRDGAETQFRQATSAAPQFIPGRYALAELQLAGGSFDAAVAEYDKILKLRPQETLVYIRLAAAHQANGDGPAAVEAYRRVIALAPEAALGYNQLAYHFADQGIHLDEALTLAQQAATLAPDNGPVLDTLGWVHYQRGEYREAVDKLALALKHMPDAPTVRYHLGLAYFKSGNPQKAIGQLENALRIPRPFPEADRARELLDELKGEGESAF